MAGPLPQARKRFDPRTRTERQNKKRKKAFKIRKEKREKCSGPLDTTHSSAVTRHRFPTGDLSPSAPSQACLQAHDRVRSARAVPGDKSPGRKAATSRRTPG